MIIGRLIGTCLTIAVLTAPLGVHAAGGPIRPALQQKLGRMLFNHRNLSLNANQACVSCHLTTNHVEDNGGVFPPLLTDFTYDNLGIPVNPRVPQLAGPQSIDYGLGARMDILTASELPVGLPKWSDGNPETVPVVESEAGKFKVPTLRNLRRTAPYGHNGFFADLETITNFYNTRDVGTWPGPEVATNMNVDEPGNLGLSAAEETAIVAFMKTLSDQSVPSPWGFPREAPRLLPLALVEGWNSLEPP